MFWTDVPHELASCATSLLLIVVTTFAVGTAINSKRSVAAQAQRVLMFSWKLANCSISFIEICAKPEKAGEAVLTNGMPRRLKIK